MSLIVQKYGGTSVANVDLMEQVAAKIMAVRASGAKVVVVLSAMSGDTDRLINLAYSASVDPEPREYDALLATGEQVSIALLAMILMKHGCKARSYAGWQIRINTDNVYKKSRILHIEQQTLQNDLEKGIIPVVAGFQGVDLNSNITTLGRGGSDTTAVALAAALKADECQIYTDVDGVYTADPRVVPEARRLDCITFEEMLELASLGSKVLQLRSVEFAGKYKVPLRVLSTFKEGPGTFISFEEKFVENAIVSGIAYNRNEAKLTIRGVPDKPGIAFYIIGSISRANIDIDMILQNGATDTTTDFTFTVHRDDYIRAKQVLEEAAKELGASEVSGNTKIAKLSLVGVGMRSHVGVATKMFETLANESINIQLITTSEIKISVVVDEKYLELGVRALHAAFNLDAEPNEEFDPIKYKN